MDNPQGNSLTHSHLSSGKGFEQLNRDLLNLYWPELILSCPNAAALFVRLMYRATQRNVVHRKHEKRMLLELSMSERTYYLALSQLEKRMWIKRTDHEIHLNGRICWHGRKPATQWNCELLCDPLFPEKRDDKWLKSVVHVA
jgi:hypothetical protein